MGYRKNKNEKVTRNIWSNSEGEFPEISDKPQIQEAQRTSTMIDNKDIYLEISYLNWKQNKTQHIIREEILKSGGGGRLI